MESPTPTLHDASDAPESTSVPPSPSSKLSPVGTTAGVSTTRHFAGLTSAAGIVGAREGDVKAYVERGEEAEEEGEGEKVSAETVKTRESGGVEGEDEKGGGLGEGEGWTYPDGGLRAWLVVFGAFIFCCSQLGYGMVWGVLLQDLERRFSTPAATLNWLQGLTNLMMNITAFFAGRIGDKFGFRRTIAVGSVATFLSLIASGLLHNSLPGLFVMQGFVLGVAQGVGMALFLAVPSQWFLKRRGLATGLATSGSGTGGGLGSLILRGTIKLGYRNALLIYAGINGCAFLVGWLCIAERHPPLKPGEARASKRWMPQGVWTDGAFWSLMGSIGVGVFGYLCPFYFITALTKLRCPQYDGNSLVVASPLIVGSVVSGVGRIFCGLVADRIGPVNTLFSSFFLGGLFQLTIWPHMTSLGSIMAFACLYGFIGSWFIPMLPPSAAQLFGTKGLATIVGFGMLCNAPGQFVGGSLGGYVLAAANNDYNIIGYYAGSAQMAGALILLWARFKGNPRWIARY
ncbi:hypothetical protein JCM8547_002920 [Rhodosporidiobolus lusitaniae]